MQPLRVIVARERAHQATRCWWHSCLVRRTDWAETEPHLMGRLMRAVWRAGQWLSKRESHIAASEILSRRNFLGVSPELIDRALSGKFTISSRAEQREVEDFLCFHEGAATFPWRSQAKWIAHRLSLSNGLESDAAQRTASAVFRSDIFRQHLGDMSIDAPGASEKVEGAIRHETAVASAKGGLILPSDTFFDGRKFEPVQE